MQKRIRGEGRAVTVFTAFSPYAARVSFAFSLTVGRFPFGRVFFVYNITTGSFPTGCV